MIDIEQFIAENRTEIDAQIRAVCDNCRIDDDERESWLRNEETLYLWAKGEGVDFDA